MHYLINTFPDYNPFLAIPGHRDYAISLSGQVRNVRTGKVLNVTVNRVGSRCYEQCALGHIHRLLKSALEGRPLGTRELVCHADGDSFHNTPDNLRVGTARQNALDKISANTNGRTLRNQDVRDIRRLAGTLTNKQLAARYRVTPGYVAAIIARRAWFNLP